MFKHNYHSHSRWCRHSQLTTEQLIKLAIEHGFLTFGISEHGQLEGNHGTQRLLDDENEKAFLDEVKALKEKYKDQIRILVGFEMEPIHARTGESQIPFMLKKENHPDVDYVIIGHHNYRGQKHVFYEKPESKENIEHYLDILEEAMKTGKFLYMAHPDGYLHAYDGQLDENSLYMAERITSLAAKYNCPLGFNLNGIFEDRLYPCLEFWKIAKKNGAKAILELDAHSAGTFHEDVLFKGLAMIQESGVELLPKLDI